MKIEEDIEISVVNGCEGKSIYINHYRVAGSKPWGGGRVYAQWNCKLKDILDALETFIPSNDILIQANQELHRQVEELRKGKNG